MLSYGENFNQLLETFSRAITHKAKVVSCPTGNELYEQ